MEHGRRPGGCSAEIELAGPVDLPASLERFRRHGDDLLDRWDGRVLRRVVPAGGRPLPLAWVVAGTVEAPRLRVTVASPARLEVAVAVSARQLVTEAAGLARLRAADPLVAALDDRFRGVRPVLQPDVLTSLVRAVSAQQVNLRWAATTRARLARAVGVRHRVAGGEVWSIDAERLAGAEPAQLRALQFTTRKAESLVGLGRAVLRGGLEEADLARLDDEAVIERLVALPGIGRWSAEWLLARTLGRPRVVAGDLAVRKAVAAAYAGAAIVAEDEVRRLTAHWGDAAGVAQQLFLHALGERVDLAGLAAAAAPAPGRRRMPRNPGQASQ